MKCNCSLNNNYEVIGVCDIEKYNKKIREFSDKAWSQIILPENLIIPDNKPSIKDIIKVYLDIKITSNKIIKTPYSDTKNIEGISSTGKILLVSGKISQRIVYVSKTHTGSLNSVKSKNSFTTYIVINEDVNIRHDAFCVYPYVEDVSILALNERTLTKSLTLFLFAHKITETPVIDKFLTKFVFKSKSNEEMATIEFDKANMELIITSTNVPYGSNPDEDAFTFSLSSSGTVKASATIKGNQTAAQFKNALHGQNFEIGDSMGVGYLDASKVSLNNYPNQGDVFNFNPSANFENFKISSTGIDADIINGTIIVKSKLDKEVLSIKLSLDRSIFIVSSTGEVPDPSSSNPYLTLILKDNNGRDKVKAILNSNENGSSFKTMVNNQAFDTYSDSLTLVYEDKSKIEILDYPSVGDVYKPTKDYDSFVIKQNGLESLDFNNRVKILNEDDETMVRLYFVPSYNNNIVALITQSTSLISTTSGDATEKYVQLLQYSQNTPKIYSEILKRETASKFVMNLDGKTVDVNELNILRLSNTRTGRIIITNYKNEAEYKVDAEPEFLEITNDALVPHSLSYNKIRFKNYPGRNVLYIYFDKLPNDNIFIQPYSTGAMNVTIDYFTFKITDPNETQIKLQGRINLDETGDVISINPPFNISKDFNIGDLFIFTYSFNRSVQIFDPPFTDPPYDATGISEKFILGRNGFEKIPPIKLVSAFLFKTYDTQTDMAKVEFDTANKKLIVTSFGNPCNAPIPSDVFSFDLIDSSKQTLTSSFITGKGNANSFRNHLNGFDFDYGYIIRLVFSRRPKVVLTDYPNQGDIYNMISPDDQTFKITQTGVVPNLFKNTITVNDSNNNALVTIEFDAYWKKFLVVSTGRNAPATGTITYFTMTLYDSDGTTQLKFSRITGGNNANSFKDEFNNEFFRTGNFLKITYKPNTVSITNYPNETNPIYTPPGTEKTFKFNENGLE